MYFKQGNLPTLKLPCGTERIRIGKGDFQIPSWPENMLSKPFSACAGPYGWDTSVLTGTTIKTRRQRQTVPWRSMAVPAKPPLEVQRHQQLFNLNVNRQLTRAGGRVSLRLMLKVNKETERGRWTPGGRHSLWRDRQFKSSMATKEQLRRGGLSCSWAAVLLTGCLRLWHLDK